MLILISAGKSMSVNQGNTCGDFGQNFTKPWPQDTKYALYSTLNRRFRSDYSEKQVTRIATESSYSNIYCSKWNLRWRRYIHIVKKECSETRWFVKYGHLHSLQKSLPSAAFNSKNSMTLFLFVVIMKLQSFNLSSSSVWGGILVYMHINNVFIFIINLCVCMSIRTRECVLCVYVCIWLYACHCTCMEVRRQLKCLSLPSTLLETGSSVVCS